MANFSTVHLMVSLKNSIWNIHSAVSKLFEDLRGEILFMHVILGFLTTSSLYFISSHFGQVHVQNFFGGGVASRVPWGWRDSCGKRKFWQGG